MKTLRLGAVCAALLLVTLLAFRGVGRHDFVMFDDQTYLTNNPEVAAGLTLRGAAWAFTTFHSANWHPLTWLSHMADVTLFGMRAGPHHLVGMSLHAANALLVFLLLHGLSGALWRSALVAALFALHPLHVESVAWAAERKDVLSMFLGLLTLLAYVRYVRRPGAARFLAIAGAFALGLLAKPMLVTLPLVLLLLDAWPLGRWDPGRRFVPPRKLWVEKIPLFALAAASSAVTWYAQSTGGAVSTFAAVPLPLRLVTAAVSYLRYLEKTLLPRDLAVLYPYQAEPSWWFFGAALALLGLVSAGALLLWKRIPALAVGWWWYLGTLVPVIGLIQVGPQAMADRYTYLPLVGVFVMAAWGAGALLDNLPALRRPLVVVCVAALAVLFALTGKQVGYWQNSRTLFEHALQAAPPHWIVYNGLGEYLAASGDVAAASEYYRQALALNPSSSQAHNNLGGILAAQGQLAAAVEHFRAALRADPAVAMAYTNLGLALSVQGHGDEAILQFRTALRLAPRQAEANYNLGVELMSRGDPAAAVGHFRAAAASDPRWSEAHAAFGAACARLGRNEEARAAYRTALELNPALESARLALEALRGGFAVSPRDPLAGRPGP